MVRVWFMWKWITKAGHFRVRFIIISSAVGTLTLVAAYLWRWPALRPVMKMLVCCVLIAEEPTDISSILCGFWWAARSNIIIPWAENHTHVMFALLYAEMTHPQQTLWATYWYWSALNLICDPWFYFISMNLNRPFAVTFSVYPPTH